MQIAIREFGPQDFVGGHPALDLANTVAGRDASHPDPGAADAPGRDRLGDYADLLRWAESMLRAAPSEGPVLDRGEIEALRALATGQPHVAGEELDRLKALREAIFAALAALSMGNAPPMRAIAEVRTQWLEAAEGAHVAPEIVHEGREHGAIVLSWCLEQGGLALPRHRLAWAAMELLTGRAADPSRVHLCAGDDCGWLFLDRSKAGRRRWCDMATCGNVAKARRHYARRRPSP